MAVAITKHLQEVLFPYSVPVVSASFLTSLYQLVSFGNPYAGTAQDAEVRWEGGEGTVDFGYCRLDKTWLS
jgi:hypothetical protein